MKPYGPNDIAVLDDVISFLQRHRTMFLQGSDNPSAADLADAVMRDIVALQAGPGRLERDNDWWVISAGKDWLAESEFGEPISLFFRICPSPTREPNSLRSECLVTAYADDAVIAGSDGIIWIKGDRANRPLPKSIAQLASGSAPGRILAFTRSADPHPFAPLVVWLASHE